MKKKKGSNEKQTVLEENGKRREGRDFKTLSIFYLDTLKSNKKKIKKNKRLRL